MTRPHEQVYTRLKVSRIHGVGVFAILDIPRGTYVFEGDTSDIVWYDEKDLDLPHQPESVQKLYEDFCILKTEKGRRKLGCPANFNNMNSSWYVNYSDKPNLAFDEENGFYTLRDIQEGEELTVDYDTYSENG